MTATGAVGLMALFVVDVANLFYISLLGQAELAAAVGFAGTLQFFTISLSIGLSIAATAVVARAIGAGDRPRARRLAASSLITLVGVLAVASAALWVWRVEALGLLGATGRTQAIGAGYLAIVLPALPLLGVGMVCGGLLRAVGDGPRAMYVTLGAGIVAAATDPLLIFGLGWGVEGAALSAVISRVVVAGIGLWGVIRVHDIVAPLDLRAALVDARSLLTLAGPMVATQLSTPFGNAYLTRVVSQFGDEAVAGWAVVARLLPLAFGGIFALSGAVGPILGQNLGAGRFDRIRAAYRDALIFAALYIAVAWGVLVLATPGLIAAFGLTGPGAVVLTGFTHIGAGAFLFTGMLFVANAAFNNLGRPVLSTAFNWSRDAGAIPLLALAIGAGLGPVGVVVIQGLAAFLVGGVAALIGWRFVARLAPAAPQPVPEVPLAQAAQAPARP